MTVQTTTNVAVAQGNGVATEFTFPFKILDEDHLVVQRRVRATGVTDKTYTSGEYTVEGVGDDEGSITLVDGALAATYDLVISRIVPYKQELDIVNQGGFFPDTVEEQLDLLAMQIQQVAEESGRSIKVALGETASDLAGADGRAGMFVAFDANGDTILASGTGADSALRTDLAASTGAALVGLENRSVKSHAEDFPHAFDFIPAAKHTGVLAGTNTDELDGYMQEMLDTGRIGLNPHSGRIWLGNPLIVPAGGGMMGNFGCELKAIANFGDNSLIRNETDWPQTLAARDTDITLEGLLLNGNRANNATGTEFSHCVHLLAVDGALLDVKCVDPKGDGVLISYSRDFDEVGLNPEIGCQNIRGRIRSVGAARQGVAITCCDDFDLSVSAYQADLLGFDIEPDNEDSYVRNGFVRLSAVECGQAGTGTRGGALIHGTNVLGTGRADVRNIDLIALILNCEGTAGLLWRDVVDIKMWFSIYGQTGHGIYGIESGFLPSRVMLFGAIDTVSGDGLRSFGNSDRVDGRVNVVDAGGNGFNLQGSNGGVLQVMSNSAGSVGLLLNNVDNMTFPDPEITGSASHGVSLTNTTAGIRMPGLKSTGNGGWGLIEAAGCNDNRATDARLSGNTSGTASLQGATSIIELEALFGKATYDAPSIAAGGTATTNITVTGATLGFNKTTVSVGVSQAGLTITGHVSAADTETAVLHNPTAGAVDLASTTIWGTVTPCIAA